MVTVTTSVFDLPDRLAAKRDPVLVAADERHFAAIEAALERQTSELSDQLDAALRTAGGLGQSAVERDLEVRRLGSRLRALRRFGLDLCLGRIVGEAGADPVYIGRLSLTDSEGRRLLVDWRAPAAEPFFAATHARPLGLASRRRYRWKRGRINDYWDEVFGPDGGESSAALDDQSAFIASLGSSRSSKMRDVLGTIQADQDAIIRAGSHGALVVDGGPGTGKTVVALHRAAYLLYADARIARPGQNVLFVGPHQPYLAYVADVLPSLGEDGVQTCTVRDLVPEGSAAVVESDDAVARIKASAAMVRAVERAVRYYEQPPAAGMTVENDWVDLWLGPEHWAEAFEAVEPGVPHNEARDQVWEELLSILLRDTAEEDVPESLLRRSIARNDDLRAAFARAWPLLDPAGVVADLWSVPAYLAKCAPWLAPDELAALHRSDPRAWTDADLPLLDAARSRIGDPEASRRRRQRAAAIVAEREQRNRVVDELIAAEVHDDGEGVMTMLRVDDLQNTLVDEDALPAADTDLLAGPFAHVVVDEAQELTDAEWQMLLARCPSRSFTIVGDRAQARRGVAESWRERLERVGLGSVTEASLTVNYRTPAEVMAEAEPVIRRALPDANVPAAIRRSGVPVIHDSVSRLTAIVDDWLATNADGVACVIGDPSFPGTARVRSLAPELTKGLEFDLVVLVAPESFGDGDTDGDGIGGAVDRYVAMTRATRQLVILTGP
ncbi:RNA polymerase recycling motor ATPase HelR [Conyzicola lurida]|uniref:RNA polymerase recycling motor ATPase HelR n=1 Tax=Conyzicola lurida TaxID=1172621 RepID=UPI00161E60DA